MTKKSKTKVAKRPVAAKAKSKPPAAKAKKKAAAKAPEAARSTVPAGKVVVSEALGDVIKRSALRRLWR